MDYIPIIIFLFLVIAIILLLQDIEINNLRKRVNKSQVIEIILMNLYLEANKDKMTKEKIRQFDELSKDFDLYVKITNKQK